MIRLNFRLDDPSATSKLDVEEHVLAAMARYGHPCTFAVIPYRETDAGRIPLARARAAHMITAQEKGLLDIALHGYTHEDTELAPKPSEFRGMPEARQREAIHAGKALLEDVFGRTIDGFVPPWNSYDVHTLHALEQAGFSYLSANLWHPPMRRTVLRQLPLTCHLPEVRQAVTEARRFSRFNPVVIVVMHHYDFPGGGDKPVYRGYGEFDELLVWLAGQKDVRVSTLGALAKELTKRETRQWHRHLAWKNQLPWRFRHWLPNLCFATRTFL